MSIYQIVPDASLGLRDKREWFYTMQHLIRGLGGVVILKQSSLSGFVIKCSWYAIAPHITDMDYQIKFHQASGTVYPHPNYP